MWSSLCVYMYQCAMREKHYLQLFVKVLVHEHLPQLKGKVTELFLQLCPHLEKEKHSSHCVQPADVRLFPQGGVEQDLLH